MVIISVIYVAGMLITNPSDGPNQYMEFNHDTLSSKISVYYEIAILVMRLIYTCFFAYALWRMWNSLKDDRQDKKVNRLAFYVHLAAMIVYTAARCAATFAFIEAAW